MSCALDKPRLSTLYKDAFFICTAAHYAIYFPLP